MTPEQKALNLAKMARAYLGLGDAEHAKALLDQLLVLLEPPKSFCAQIPNPTPDHPAEKAA